MKITAQSVIENAKDFVALPEIYSRINEKIDDENSSDVQIGALIAVDPALTSKLLRMVNSAYFGLASPVAEISSAVGLIGRWEVKSLLLGSAIQNLFDRPDDITFLRQFWKHSVRTGLFARLISYKLQIGESPEVMFTAGMLHDIGRLLIRYQLSEEQQQIEHLIETESIPESAAELQILGFDHTDLGALLIRSWGVPENLSVLVRGHHLPSESGSLIAGCQFIGVG